MNHKQLTTSLQQLLDGKIALSDLVENLSGLQQQVLSHTTVDHHREIRQGAPEVIFGAGKTPEQIIDISLSLLANGSDLLITRAPHNLAPLLKQQLPQNLLTQLEYFPSCKLIRLLQRKALSKALIKDTTSITSLSDPHENHSNTSIIGVICAGTSDLPVAEEAQRSAEFFGMTVELFVDVGVAGLDRLLVHQKRLRELALVIVIAGMEGALPSVIGGLVATPVIAVPTSVGYGSNLAGFTPLLSMLNSCAAGITVMNIDNGFGAAAAAHRIVLSINREPCS